MIRQLDGDILFPAAIPSQTAVSELLYAHHRAPSGKTYAFLNVAEGLHWTARAVAGEVCDATRPAFPPLVPNGPEEIR